MTARTIETKAIISAEDKTGNAFAAVVQKLARMEDAAKAANIKMGSVDRAAETTRRTELAHSRKMLTVQQETAKAARQMAMAVVGAYAAHEGAHFARESLDTYREFDKERRFGKAVMGISDAEQNDLVRQAIHMGATTKFNDIQVLESQRELAARGLNKDQILGMMKSAGDLGQALDLSLPESVKQMEGAIFGFKKAVGTTSEAMRSAQQTADVQVKAAKISGMTPEDIRQVYKYGATPARMSGVSEQFLLAFGGISKKANMGGDEAGVAFRALMSAGQSPTRGAKEALLANGLDYSKYQRPIGAISVDPFVRNVAAQYGVALNQKATAALTKVFSDPQLLNDPAKFTPAVVGALGDTLGKKDAKSLKSIAGMANRFRNASGGGADVNGFLMDLMMKLPGNIKLSNAIFGSKQGARIANALGDPEVLKAMKDMLTEHSEGYAKKVADGRMSGFDGAMSRFEGAVKNLESALPRAFDKDGKGGMLTGVTDQLGKFVQSLAEAPPQLQRLAVEATALAGLFAGLKGAESLMSGFGLKGSAVALTEAAHLLMGAAGEHRVADAVPGGIETKIKGRLGSVAKSIPLVGTILIAGEEGLSALDDYNAAHPEQFKKHQQAVTDGFARYQAATTPPPRSPFGALPDASTFKKDFSFRFEQPPAQSIKIEVSSSSNLLSILEGVRELKSQLKAKADSNTGPGGLGPTSTHQ